MNLLMRYSLGKGEVESSILSGSTMISQPLTDYPGGTVCEQYTREAVPNRVLNGVDILNTGFWDDHHDGLWTNPQVPDPIVLPSSRGTYRRALADAKRKQERAERAKRDGCVYFLRCGESGPIKIGWALDETRRRHHLQTGHHEKLMLLASVPGTRLNEGQWHARFAHLRLRGEWFRPAPELLAAIAALSPPSTPSLPQQDEGPSL